jgi:hypothetical protein
LQLLILAAIQRLKSIFNILLVNTNLKEIIKLFKKSLNTSYKKRMKK